MLDYNYEELQALEKEASKHTRIAPFGILSAIATARETESYKAQLATLQQDLERVKQNNGGGANQ